MIKARMLGGSLPGTGSRRTNSTRPLPKTRPVRTRANNSEKKTLLYGTPHSEKLRSLPGLARVSPAHLGGKKRSHRGHRGRRGTRGFLQQLGWSNVSGVWETRRALLATQPPRPPGLEAPHPAQEQGSSRVVRMVSASTCCGK